MKILKVLAPVGLSLTLASGAYASCDGVSGNISILSNSFPTFDIFSKEFDKCKGGNFDYQWKKTSEHKTEQVTAFASKKGPYDAAFVANSSIGVVQARGLLRPLDDFVAKYKDKYKIEDNMLVRIDGKIFAVAFMANAQHFMYRKDLFKKHGIPVPKTYSDVLAAAKILKKEASIEFPFGAAYKSGWNVSQEFNNIFLAHGGQHFKSGSFKPNINNDKGIKTLELMKKLKSYQSPNALVIDSGVVQQMLRDGKLGMAFLWGNRAAAVDDAKTSKVVGKVGLISAPKIASTGNVASTVFWDGFVLPKNAPNDPEQTFKNMMHLYSERIVAENNDATIWLRSNYKIGKYANGVVETVENGAPAFPSSVAYTHMHNAAGKHIGAFLAGEKSAQEALRDAEADYIKIAKENSILK